VFSYAPTSTDVLNVLTGTVKRSIHMAILEPEVCLLSAQEATAWDFYGKPPARCDKNVHKHVSQSEARKLASGGEARLVHLRGRWCLISENPKRGYEVRSSGGYVGLQLVAD